MATEKPNETTVEAGSDRVLVGSVTIGHPPPPKSVTIGPNRELYFGEDGTILVYGRPVGRDEEVFQAIRSWAMASSAFSLGGTPPFVRHSHLPDWPMTLMRSEAGKRCAWCPASNPPDLRDGDVGQVRNVELLDGRSLDMCVRCLVDLGAEIERVRERAGQRQITPDDIYRLTREWSAADRSRVMSALRWPTTRRGVVSGVTFNVVWLFRRDMVCLDLGEAPPAYIDKRNLKTIWLSLLSADDLRRQREEDLELDLDLKDPEVAKSMKGMLMGRQVTIDEHPTADGVAHRAWVKDEAEDDHGP